MDNYLTRTESLLGKDNLEKLSNKTVFIAGIGGVGGATFIALVRSGIKRIIVMDFDTVEPTNLNRQILFSSDDVGKSKVECAAKYAKSISEDIEIIPLNEKLNSETISQLDNFKIDYIVDAVDDLKAKKLLVKYAYERQIPIICSLGMALRMNSTDIFITTLDKTHDDPLAKKLRQDLRKDGIDISKIDVVYSKEIPQKPNEMLSSIFFAPNRAGFLIAEHLYFLLLK